MPLKAIGSFSRIHLLEVLFVKLTLLRSIEVNVKCFGLFVCLFFFLKPRLRFEHRNGGECFPPFLAGVFS